VDDHTPGPERFAGWIPGGHWREWTSPKTEKVYRWRPNLIFLADPDTENGIDIQVRKDYHRMSAQGARTEWIALALGKVPKLRARFLRCLEGEKARAETPRDTPENVPSFSEGDPVGVAV
jgi:hypothetical protein